MSEPTKATVKALTDYGYARDGDIFMNLTKGKRWTWQGDHFTYEVGVGGGWFPVANHYNTVYADSKRSPDHSWYEFPDRGVWEFTQEEVRTSYQAGMKARRAQAAFNAETPDETFAGLVPG